MRKVKRRTRQREKEAESQTTSHLYRFNDIFSQLPLCPPNKERTNNKTPRYLLDIDRNEGWESGVDDYSRIWVNYLEYPMQGDCTSRSFTQASSR